MPAGRNQGTKKPPFVIRVQQTPLELVLRVERKETHVLTHFSITSLKQCLAS